MWNRTHGQILEVKGRAQGDGEGFLERLMREERDLYVAQHLTKGTGFAAGA